MYAPPAVIKATVEKFRTIASQYTSNEETIKRLQSENELLGTAARRCYETAELFGFDLVVELAKVAQPGTSGAEAPVPVIRVTAPAPPSTATVRGFALDAAQRAHPNPVHAASLQAAYEDQFKRKVHPKTFGMILYRLSLDKLIRREGRKDWYFVPEHERPGAQPHLFEETAE